MKILTAEQMAEVDRLSSSRAGIPSLTLMENAGRHTADALRREFPQACRINVLCGKGNNGGDGLVAARYLHQQKFEPAVALFANPADLVGDARSNYEALAKTGAKVEAITSVATWHAQRSRWLDCDVVVDALLGTGLAGPAHGLVADVIEGINAARSGYRVLAVDIPSGLPSDSGEPIGVSVEADCTITFTAPKMGHIFPPHCERAGKLIIASIGSPPELYENNPDLFLNLITAHQFVQFPFRRPRAAHKGEFGHVLVVAGSRGKSGAAAMAGLAGLRAGAGLVSVATPESVLPVVAGQVAEIMTEPLAETEAGTISSRALDYGRFAKILEGKTVLAMGPGLGQHPETVQFVRSVVRQCELPLVLDADALNVLVGQLDLLRERRARVLVVTPHPGEMARLVGSTSAEVQCARVGVARSFAQEYGAFVILKGYRTLVATPEAQVYVNPTGNPGMASGGSGDVLTGLLAGLLAQSGSTPLADVLSLGVYLHGRAGDLAAEAMGEAPLIARDILQAFPRALRELEERVNRDVNRDYYVVP
ncbi:MAG: NAD(P)H-hydrate dehydratase [Terriglobia bacterium]